MFIDSHLHLDFDEFAADREAVTAYSARQTALAQDHEIEYRFLAKDGRSVWLHDTTKIICEDGKPRWLRGLLVDISVRKAPIMASSTCSP